MAKRKQGELAAESSSDDAVSDISVGFGFSEVVKSCFHLHPILKGTQAGGGKDCYDQLALISEASKSEISEGEDGGFTGAEVMNNHYRLHPILKDIKGGGGKHFASVFLVPDGQRSEGHAFGELDLLKNHYLLYLLRKTIDGGTKNDCCDQLHSIFQFAKGKRSKGRVPRKPRVQQDAESDEVRILNESKSRYLVRRGRRKVKSSAPGLLNSEKFEFYIESIWRKLTNERKKELTYFDSLWFSLYSEGLIKRKVLGWIQKKNIFSKKYVFVPIVQWRHWFLLILCNFNESSDSTTNRCMLLLDSLQEANSKRLEPGIRRFVFDIFKTEERPERREDINKIPLLIPKVPQQRNGEECGFFVVYYINQFLQSVGDQVDYPDFMKEDWFNPEEVEGFIKTLDSIIT